MSKHTQRPWLLALLAFALVAAGLLAPRPASAAATSPALSEEEASAVLFMREEEKMARDLYTAFGEQYDLPIFDRIAVSEQRHFDAVGTLITRYDLDDPAVGKAPGEFSDPALQAMYDQLLADGSNSLAAALQVGVTVEETDIADIEERLTSVTQFDVKRVFTMLLRGSQHHLNAFTKLVDN